MKTLKIVFMILAAFSTIAVATFFLINYLKPKPGGLMVDTTPESGVYINENFVGKTPYKGMFTSGQINLRLVPIITDQDLIAYETKVSLISGIQTVVRREFGKTEDVSSGDVISFNKAGDDSTGLIIISDPDNSQVLIDGEVQGFSPYNMGSITTGIHQITIKSTGFIDRTMSVKTLAGYSLTVYAKLAKSQEILPSPVPSVQPESSQKTYVIIDNTPTGFLRMRTEPDVRGEEIAELKSGSKYLFLEEDVSSGWFKIQYKDPVPGLPEGMNGWVSNQYSKISTESGVLRN